MNCGYECHKIGGPWIAENPKCPIHGVRAQIADRQQDRNKQSIEDMIDDAEDLADIKDILRHMLAVMQ
jgi:hypothetical protein